MLQNFDRNAEKCNNIESDHLKILYYDLPKGYQDTYKSYSNYRLCTMLSGKKRVSINDKNSFAYSTSEYVLLPPQSSVQMTISSHTKAVVYEFDNQIIDYISNKVEQKFDSNSEIKKNIFSADLRNSVTSLNNKMFQNDKTSRVFMDLYAQEVILRLMDENNKALLTSSGLRCYNPAQTAMEIIKKPGNENLLISEIAQMIGMSQANLTYYFKKEYKTSPKKFQNLIKIERARYLLYSYSVTEVAMELGFENISHFIRLFKEMYKQTPKQFKRRPRDMNVDGILL